MELREWLIILGLILMAIIVIDGVRRLQRQRQSSRLDAGHDAQQEKSESNIARETAWELPNGGARVVKEATVQPPARQSSAFERQGLKTRIPEGESVTTRAAVSAEDALRSSSSTTTITADAEPSEGPGAAAEADTMTDAAPKPKDNVTASSTTACDVADHAASLQDDDAQSTLISDDIDDDRNETEYEAASALKRSVKAPAETSEQSSVELSTPLDEQHDDDELAPEPFDVPEEEVVDDPRYEGLSEILWRRPLDIFAHLKEALAERRVRKEHAREEARIRRLEVRARRAEEKEKRRLEREAEQQRAHEEALVLQAQQQEENEHARQQRTASVRHSDPLASLDDDDPLFAPSSSHRDERGAYAQDTSEYADGDGYRDDAMSEPYDVAYADEPAWEDKPQSASSGRHPDIERAYRHLVNGAQARETLAAASEVIAIAVMSRDGGTFDGMTLLKLMLACGLRYCPTTRVFHRFETDDDHSPLQFSVIDTLKPGEFPLDDMDEFTTKGVWLLMPMPGAHELGIAFEAMYETARAIARYLEGELRDENQSVITAQTVEFSRQRVQEFERRAKLYHPSR